MLQGIAGNATSNPRITARPSYRARSLGRFIIPNPQTSGG